MTKKAMIDEMKNAGIEKSEEVYELMMNIISTKLQNDEEVTLNGIGKLKTKSKNARKGINPKTGEKIDIPAKRAVAFTSSKAIKEVLN